jgi:DNA-binding CsgD family transcriptional regulator
MRSCLIATALARRHGLSEPEVSEAFYTALLMHVGCSALSHETAVAFGDERPVLTAVAATNVADPDEIAGRLVPAILNGKSPAERDRILRFIVSPEGQRFGHSFDTGTCEVASVTARRVGLGEGVARALKQAVEWWNGEGPPEGLEGEQIALPARVARAATDAARFDALGGIDAVVEALRRRSGNILDPSVVDTLTVSADELLADSRAGDPRERVLEGEPEPVIEVDPADTKRVAEAFGDLADVKTPWTPEALAPAAAVAGRHHERLDGSGYYRGCAARELPPAARVLAAADAFHAMTQERPHRPALPMEQAADELQREARGGRLDGDVVAAVLEAAGARRPRRRNDLRPAGLSERKVEVARLVAAGCSNPEIATRLVISRRTAEHHVQNIYAKVGVASRAGLALFVHEHHLIDAPAAT